jgi:uncharacterized membrane protein (UPF0127 family)
MGTLKRVHTGEVLLTSVEVASSFWSRFLGLMGRRSLEGEAGLLITRCSNIHMWFMRFPIDVLFVRGVGSNQFRVEGVQSSLQPWRILPVGVRGATDVFELPEGQVKSKRIEVGELLCLS